MRTHGRKILLAVLVLSLAVGVGGCWGKKRTSRGTDVEAILRTCPPVDIVYVMDTSGSMDSISAAVCAKIEGVNAELVARGLSDIQATVLGITQNGEWSTGFACISDNVLNLLGPTVPGSGGTLNSDEDWGPGGAIVCERFAWRPNSLRIVVPVSDEGAEDGGTGSDMIDADDTAAMDNLVAVAQLHNVVVSPMWGSDWYPAESQDPAFLAALNNIADSTGGSVTLNPSALDAFDDALFNIILFACENYTPPEEGTGNGTQPQ